MHGTARRRRELATVYVPVGMASGICGVIGVRVLFRTTHNVPKPAGALALAGLLAERHRAAGKRVGVIQTGGNADTGLLLQVLAGQTPTI